MRVRGTIWGGVFVATVVFTAGLTLDILANNADIAAAIYSETRMGVIFPAEVVAVAALSVPVISAISGIMFLLYFTKNKKQRKLARLAANS